MAYRKKAIFPNSTVQINLGPIYTFGLFICPAQKKIFSKMLVYTIRLDQI